MEGIIENWITKNDGLLVKRRSMYSTVNIIVSNDEKRVKQLKEYLAVDGVMGKSGERKLIWNEWLGLRRIDSSGGETPEAVESTGFGASAGISGMLKQIDANVKGNSTVVIFEATMEPNKVIATALNSWAMDESIFEAGSTICVFVPATSYFPDSVLEKCNVINVPSSTMDERMDIVEETHAEINKLLKKKAKPVSKKQRRKIATITGGLLLGQLEGALCESYVLHNKFDLQHLSRFKAEQINKGGVLTVVDTSNYGFDMVGGYEALKRFIRVNVLDVYQNKERAEYFDIEPPKGILIFGPPGTGKSLIAKCISEELNFPMASIEAKGLFGSKVGESEQKTHTAIKTIDSMEPCSVHIDEVDALAPKRKNMSDGDSGVSKRVFGSILTWLADPRSSFVIGVTNRIQDMDEAFIRAGRFDFIACMLLPNVDARKDIVNVHLNVARNVPNKLKDKHLDWIAENTAYYNGADIEMLVKKAAFQAMKEGETDFVKLEHFKYALENTIVNVSDRKKQQEDYMKLVKKFVNDKRFITEAKLDFEKPKKSRASLAGEMVNE